MGQEQPTNLVTVTIDGHAMQVPKGTNMIEVARQISVEIPHYCYHPKLTVAGNCRMCLVEMGNEERDRETGKVVLDDQGKAKVRWIPRPQIACTMQAAEGLHIRTQSDLVKDCRNGVMEFLLVNHPLDCPICDQAGECTLQEYATDYGRGYSRFIDEKNVKPKRTELGPRVTLDDERCILCSRCIRFMKEIAKDDVLGFVDRGSYSTLTCYPEKKLESNYSLNTVDICPVGALTSTDFRFKMRVWFLKRVKSICTESSVGVNTWVWSREGKVYRITPRDNDAVNDCWMADSGRELYKQIEAPTRLTMYSVEGEKYTILSAIEKVAEAFKRGRTAIVASAQMSVEEQFLLNQIATYLEAPVWMASHWGSNDGLLISEDRTPNVRGALLSGLIRELPKADLKELTAEIESGRIQNVMVFNEDLTSLGLSEQVLRKVKVVYCGAQQNATERLATIVLPMLTVFEKTGSFVNEQFRLQTFDQVVPGPAGLLPDMHVLGRLYTQLTGKSPAVHEGMDALWKWMGESVAVFKGIQFTKIPDTGLLMAPGALGQLRFPEGKSLHYDPSATDLNKRSALQPA
jgi:NADH-quinone oxidoreductase subunit G